jgi:hypothetical protein
MTHVPKKKHRKISLACGIRCCSMLLFLFPNQPLYTVKNIVYKHTTDCVQTVYALPLLLNNIASETLLHQSRVVLCTEWVFMTGTPACSDMANTWHWTKCFTVPLINCWHKSPNQNQVKIPFPVKRWLQCFGYCLMVSTIPFCSHFVFWVNS